jgi:hypothetical protein
MSATQTVGERRAHLAELVLELGEEDAMKWLEEKVWIEDEDEYGGENLPELIVNELDIVSDEDVERYIAELEA